MAMNKKFFSYFLVTCLLFSASESFSQLKYWIKLKDKNGTPYSISNPSVFLSSKSIARRTTYSIPLDATDLPVTPTYIAQIDTVQNVTVLYASKWLNGVVISIPNLSLVPVALNTIKTFSFVLDTLRVKKYRIDGGEFTKVDPNNNFTTERSSSETSGQFSYGGSYWQNKQMNVIPLHEQGYRGQGMTIAVLDVGFSNVNTSPVFDSLRTRGGILGTRNFVNGGTEVYSLGPNHGTAVLSCIAGNIPGSILGSAPMANFWLLRTEDDAAETISEEYNWIRGAEFADSVGADILTTSLGYTEFDYNMNNHTYATLTGRKAPMSIAATMAARKGLFVLNAAGNEGANSWHYISVPGDADSICTVGAIDTLDQVAAFSSVGPTYDNRIKPDLVARGVGTWVTEGGTLFPGNGTSFATPVLAGGVACYWQAHKNANNIQILDALRKGANNHCSPNNSRGWGIPVLYPALITLKFNAFLENKNNHSGIKVKFTAISPTTNSDSTLTDASGSYSINLYPGTYKVTFSKNYYITDNYGNNAVTVDNCPVVNLNDVTLKAMPSAPKIDFDFTAYADVEKEQMTIFLTDAGYESVHIQVCDLLGRVLLESDSDRHDLQVSFDISNLSDEIYLVKVKTSQGTKTKKVLKKK